MLSKTVHRRGLPHTEKVLNVYNWCGFLTRLQTQDPHGATSISDGVFYLPELVIAVTTYIHCGTYFGKKCMLFLIGFDILIGQLEKEEKVSLHNNDLPTEQKRRSS